MAPKDPYTQEYTDDEKEFYRDIVYLNIDPERFFWTTKGLSAKTYDAPQSNKNIKKIIASGTPMTQTFLDLIEKKVNSDDLDINKLDENDLQKAKMLGPVDPATLQKKTGNYRDIEKTRDRLFKKLKNPTILTDAETEEESEEEMPKPKATTEPLAESVKTGEQIDAENAVIASQSKILTEIAEQKQILLDLQKQEEEEEPVVLDGVVPTSPVVLPDSDEQKRLKTIITDLEKKSISLDPKPVPEPVPRPESDPLSEPDASVPSLPDDETLPAGTENVDLPDQETETKQINVEVPKSEFAPKYHLDSILFFFGTLENPAFDPVLSNNVKTRKLSKETIIKYCDALISSYSTKWLVFERQSQGDYLELNELLQLETLWKRNLMAKGKQALVNIGDLTRMSNKLAASSRPNNYVPPSAQTVDDIPASAEDLANEQQRAAREQENADLPRREITEPSTQVTEISTVTESQIIADFLEAYDKKGTYENGKLIMVGEAVEAMRLSRIKPKAPKFKDPELKHIKIEVKPKNKVVKF
jgi:hypothetical protein